MSEQAKTKLKEDIEVSCNRNLTDPILKNGMAHLIELSRSIKMKPSWSDIDRYGCSHRGKRVVYYKIDKDKVTVIITLTDTGKKDELKELFPTLPDDLKKEFVSSEARHCRGCPKTSPCPWGESASLEWDGNVYYICSRFNYTCVNPTPEQFEMIERLIHFRRAYIRDTAK